ncbi:MAG: FIST N-terminal domain-containing protein [Pseudomonadota bacterium]
MKIVVERAAGATAAQDLCAALAEEPQGSLVFLQANAACDLDGLRDAIARMGGPAFIGATSCLGTMSHQGHAPELAALMIVDPEGDYGAAAEPLDSDAEAAARRATERAVRAADRPGEKPELVWVSGTPGREEEFLAGIESVVGQDVPIIGGSAADNDVTGQWAVFDAESLLPDGIAIGVLFPSASVSFAYQNGYAPTAHSGRVTAVDGRRLAEIDGQPAAEVYSRWTEGAVAVPKEGGDGQPILAKSTFWPLGREISEIGGVPQFLLAHPAAGDADGTLHLFATVTEGETLTQMSGSPDSLVERAGRVAALARGAGQFRGDGDIAGALMVYCGGCMLAVQDRVDEVVGGIVGELGEAPFMGIFTFGEQGRVFGAGNRHGNLMISCIIFGR